MGIFLPSYYILIVMVMLNHNFSLAAKLALFFTFHISKFTCMYLLRKVSQTDPGILPSVNQISLIPELSKRYPDSDRDYIIEYLDEEELSQTLP